MYFRIHPDFKKGDHNERLVNKLLRNHLEGENDNEFSNLVAAMAEHTLYQQILDKYREQDEEEAS